ncbi:MAG TPA: tetratricopeptide repeat protein [Bryobacteraceae bacterium]|nr:tetratricopeptide repeat protein [Bryobacteraceae bacterium]
MVGRTISHYEILEKLGQGGMGVVYCARDLRLDRLVALKILPAEQIADERRRGRFIREAQTASALNHPNIVTIYEIANTDGVDYIVMEFVRGSTLREAIPPNGLDLADALKYANQIASGLAAAHAAGIVHRDVKPANIMITKTGLVKLLDFGLAQIEQPHIDESAPTGEIAPLHLTRPGTIIGTAAYMSPEQAQGQGTDQRSDIFCFGIVLYQMLTGALPFQSNSEVGLMYQIVHASTPSASQVRRDLPPALDRVLRTALEKDPKLRYPSMEGLLTDLRQVTREMETNTIVMEPSVARRLAQKRRWRSPAAIVAFVASFLLLAGVLLWKFAPNVFARVPTEKKIAVLPFRNIGDNKDNEAFRDGLMEALTSELTELSQFHGTLWVVPATEVRRGAFTSAKDAERALGVNLVITGSVQRDAAHVHLTANLVDANTLRQLRSREITRPAGEVANLQEAVVQEVAGMLQLELGTRERQVLAAGETSASGAYDYYLQARGHLQRRGRGDIDQALEMFQKAITLDPKYALAYAGLGEAYWWKYRVTRDTQWTEPAQKNCKTALALNDRLAPVYVTLGIIDEGAGQHEDAIKAFQRALQLDPISATAYAELANVYEATGKLDEAESTFKKAAQLRPGDWTSASLLGAFYFRRGRYPEAVTYFRQVTELAPENAAGYSNLGGLFFSAGQYKDAEVNFKKSLDLRPTANAYTNLGTMYFFMDRCADAIPMMEKAVELTPKGEQVWGNLGDAYSCSPPEKAKATQAYQRALQLGEERLAVNPKDADVLGRVALYQARLGNPASLLSIAKAQQLAPDNRQVVWHATLVYELAGKRDLALQALQAALKAGQAADEVRHEPTLLNLRADPRFTRLMAGQPVKAK